MSVIPNKSFEVKFSDDDHVDLVMEEGHISVTQGKDQWLQANKIGLIGQEGDWNFDPSEGMPWVDNGKLPPGRMNIMGTQLDHDMIEIYIRQQLNREPRNKSIEDVNVEWSDKSNRGIQARAKIKSIKEDLILVEV